MKLRENIPTTIHRDSVVFNSFGCEYLGWTACLMINSGCTLMASDRQSRAVVIDKMLCRLCGIIEDANAVRVALELELSKAIEEEKNNDK